MRGHCVEVDFTAMVKAGRLVEDRCNNPDDGEDGAKWPDSEDVLKVAPGGFADGLTVQREEQESKGNASFLA